MYNISLDYLVEIQRLWNIFRTLDKMYQQHTPENPYGLLDSPQSLIIQTRMAIDEALKLKKDGI